MDQVWHQVWNTAPVPALHVEPGLPQTPWRPNAAAQRWAAAQGLGDADWQALAARWAGPEAGATGPDTVGVQRLALQVQRVPLPDGTLLLWLQPEQPQAEALQRKAAFLEQALVLAGISLWRIDLQSQRIHFNAVGFHVMGMVADPLGIPLDTMRDTIHPDDVEAVVRAADEAMASDRIVDVVARYRNTDGSWRTLMTRRSAERDAQGRVVALSGVSLDLTGQVEERRQAQALLEHTRLAAATMGVGFWSRNLDTGDAHWDEQMYRIHRRPRELGPPGFDDWIDQHVHPQDRAWAAELHRRASADWQPVVDASFRVPDADGGERWVQSWTRRLVRDGQRLAFGMHLDVTERQREQALLQRERARTQFAIEAAELGVWERGLDGQGLFWNAAMYRLRGLDPGDARPIETLARLCAHPDDFVQLDQLAQRHLVDGTPYRYEFRVRLPDGSERWLVTQGRSLRDGQGRLLGMAGINLDITERKQAEVLRQQTQRAEQAARDQSAFLARVSHELRTPMNAVLGFTQLLDEDRSEPPSVRQRERLHRIHDAGLQMMALVDDLLDLASLEAEPLAGGERVPLATLLPQVLDGWREQARQRGVLLRCGALPGAVRGDPRRLAQLLSHLLGHALRRQAAGGQVEVDSQLLPGDGAAAPQLLLRVRDAGPPYSDEECRHLFEPFRRQGAARRSGEGTGIGLALAWRLARALGGALEPPPAGCSGGELHLRLPAEPVAVAPDAAPALPPPSPLLQAAASSPPLHVLCVEDNPVNLLLVRELLALRPGVRLREAPDGQTGITMALAEPPDVLLLDLQLPDLSGLDVLRRLRAEPALARCCFVALSADAMPDRIARARDAGFDDYWTKPIDFAQFLAGIDRLAAR